jgi:undecaprenyl-diphosphatase
MSGAQVQMVFRHLDRVELRLCQTFNRSCRRWWLQEIFSAVSWLGNGIFWYVLMFFLATTQGRAGLIAASHMGGVGGAGVLVYRFLKQRTVRERPFVAHAGIRLGAAPLDRFSFPSGHTLHAVAFSVIALSYFPVLAWILVPFGMLTALSRIVLGLHYPSDVIVGAVLGLLLAHLSFYI